MPSTRARTAPYVHAGNLAASPEPGLFVGHTASKLR
jgi:hypothetical protein